MGDRAIEPLAQMTCVACRRDEPTLTDAEVGRFVPQLPDWEVLDLDGIKRLRRVFTFADFAQALAFTDRVGALAAREGHHPALLTEWGRTTVSWWTHTIKGLHRNDLIMAAKTDEIRNAVHATPARRTGSRVSVQAARATKRGTT